MTHKPLTATQQRMYDALKANGSVQKGDGYRLTTALALASRALISLEQRTDATGKVTFWRARFPRPVEKPTPTQPAASTAPRQGNHVIRVGVRNPNTEQVTYTEVRHVADRTELDNALRALDVPERHQLHGTGGVYTSQRRKIVWRELSAHTLREFVCGGEVYRVERDLRFGGYQAVHDATDQAVASGPDYLEVETRAREDAASFNGALRHQ
jgi:hypothetical protein